MIQDAAGKPVALDLETAPTRVRARAGSRRCRRNGRLSTPRRSPIGRRRRRSRRAQAEIDAITAEAEPKLKVLDAKIDYAKSAGLDPHRAEVRLAQVYGGGPRVAVIDIRKTGLEALSCSRASGSPSQRALRSRFSGPCWRHLGQGPRCPTGGAADSRRLQMRARPGSQTLYQGRSLLRSCRRPTGRARI